MEITLSHFRESLFQVMDELFTGGPGMFLDKGTSLFETLDGISAEVASRPMGDSCASIAAQVEHTRYYLVLIERVAREGDIGPTDWDATWQKTTVTEDEWEQLKSDLRQAHDAIRVVLNEDATFNSPYAVGGSMMIVAHTTYHLGEIRRSLCMVGRQ